MSKTPTPIADTTEFRYVKGASNAPILIANPYTGKEVNVRPFFDFLARYGSGSSENSTSAFAAPILNAIRHISTCTADDVDANVTTVVQLGLWPLVDCLAEMEKPVGNVARTTTNQKPDVVLQ